MRKIRNDLIGFILFFITASFNVGIGIITYSLVEDKDIGLKILIIVLTTLFITIFLSFSDYLRRKVMIERPLKEILTATESMSKGNFKIRLIPHHSYEDYNEFDYIKDDLNKLAKELSKSEVLKSDFIANVSHEIKTPLSIIQNYAKVLDNDSLSVEERKKYLVNLQNACKKLSDLVTNILKLNKLENQKIDPKLKRFNLSESLTNQIIQYEELIERKNIELKCDIDEDLYINSEESYLELIWNNLISNAIKFTDNNGIIEISLKKKEKSYIVTISDTGIGMDIETGKHIFEKFYQGDTSHSKEGNGLGLSLVKKVIDILGGSISVKSELGKGTTFIVVIKE